MSPPILFDAVLFDLDGTLVATERFWVAAAARGAQRAFAELGLDRPLPGAEEWLSMVGLPLELGFAIVFPDLAPAVRARVMARCVEEEQAAVRAGGAAPMPGSLEALAELRGLGVKLGIASNCSQNYLDSIVSALHLGEFVHEARCLESPGVRSKTDMLRDLLRTFGTRSAVMVGDRATDAQAAHANALPHVHVASGLAPRGEHVDCEATIGGLDELGECLRGRARWIERALGELGLFEPRARALTLGITGGSASGKTLFARDAAKLLAARGRAAATVSLDAFLRRGASHETLAEGQADDHLGRAWDLGSLSAAVLQPRARGEATRAGPWGSAVPPDAVLLFEGLFLADPRLRAALDRLLRLEVPDVVALARVAAREGSAEAVLRVRRDFLPAQRDFEQRHPPAAADLRLAAANPLGD